jgi:cAMP-dependent protein kinase regulator
VAPGEAILEQGEAGDAFYAIGSGQVEVVKDGILVRTLGPGAHFGEIALLQKVPRTASVVARTPVRAFRLDREGFDGLMAGAFRKGTLKPSSNVERTWQH